MQVGRRPAEREGSGGVEQVGAVWRRGCRRDEGLHSRQRLMLPRTLVPAFHTSIRHSCPTPHTLRPCLVHTFCFRVLFPAIPSLPGPSPHTPSHSHQAAAQQIFMDKHGGQDRWLSGNFVYFRMSRIVDIYFVGGFGTVQWITAEEYLSSRPDDIVLDKPTALLQVGAWGEAGARLGRELGRGTHCGLESSSTATALCQGPSPALSCPLLTLPPRCPLPVNTEPDPHVCQ